MLGIDEAGRGPVLGPMAYGAAYWSCADDKYVSGMGFDDSKVLSSAHRDELFNRIDQVGATTPEASLRCLLKTMSYYIAKVVSGIRSRLLPYGLQFTARDILPLFDAFNLLYSHI